MDRNDLILRRAREADLAHIVRMLSEDALGATRESPELPLRSSYVEAFAAIDSDPNAELVVAELEGEVVGSFQLYFLNSISFRGSRVAQIEAVRVTARLRNQGLGRSMMKWAIERARERDCRRVQLTTDKTRKDAHRFYESLGFRSTHEGMKLPL